MAYPDDGDTIETRIIAELMARMAAIQPPGYHTAVRDALLLEDDTEVSGELPAIGVFPHEDTLDDRSNCELYHELRVLISVAVASDGPADVWRREVNWLLSDVKHAILTDPQFGGLVSRAAIIAEAVPPRDPSMQLAYGDLELVIRFHHIYDNPCIQST